MQDDLITQLGGPSAVARMVGCKPPSVTEWRGRGIPPERCPAIERHTGGRFPCERLRGDINWVRVPDPAWPWHPDGRPLRDDTAHLVGAPPVGTEGAAAIPEEARHAA